MELLAGTTVVAVEQAVSGPLATRQLADLGARVIKIERVEEGDFARDYDATVRGSSSYFVWCNRSKESVTLDLKQPAGMEVVGRLLERADVFLQNLAPGAAERLGLGAAVLRARHPRMVVCGIDGYGAGGPYSEQAAYDLLVQCEAGLLAVTGSDETPAKVGISIADIAAATQAYVGILVALHRRLLTGEGSLVLVSMLEALGEWMSQPAYFARYGGTPPPRTGSHHATIAPYGPCRCGDGESVFVAVQNDREWRRLCLEVLGQPELGADPRFCGNQARVRHRGEVDRALGPWFQSVSSEQALTQLRRSRIACARWRQAAELWEHPQVVARGRLLEVETAGGPVAAFPPAAQVEGIDYRMGPVPSLGANTDSVLAELGYGQQARSRLRDEGVI